jgi:hypothetical protein
VTLAHVAPDRANQQGKYDCTDQAHGEGNERDADRQVDATCDCGHPEGGDRLRRGVARRTVGGLAFRVAGKRILCVDCDYGKFLRRFAQRLSARHRCAVADGRFGEPGPCRGRSSNPRLSVQNKKNGHPQGWPFFLFLAERRGFEPRIGYEPIHAFQACDFNHSSISPAFLALTKPHSIAEIPKPTQLFPSQLSTPNAPEYSRPNPPAARSTPHFSTQTVLIAPTQGKVARKNSTNKQQNYQQISFRLLCHSIY